MDLEGRVQLLLKITALYAVRLCRKFEVEARSSATAKALTSKIDKCQLDLEWPAAYRKGVRRVMRANMRAAWVILPFVLAMAVSAEVAVDKVISTSRTLVKLRDDVGLIGVMKFSFLGVHMSG